MSTLRQTIEAHAHEFAAAIVQALRGASLDELVSITGGQATAPRAPRAKTNGATTAAPEVAKKVSKKAGRLGRRSADDIARTLEQIVAVLAKHPEGLRAEQIKAALNLDTREVPRPLAEGLNSGALTKSGQKRATTYFAGGGKKRAKK
ncbi:MAG: hypothetical protein BGO98_46685 [Myxococcales bacterium 68-20]|nr:hypothetical protein [Myxococcales bacterium]OJY23077.1 MAG: hypothetical protein BGO98_46685 [Myxococcales bacterium 68-20]